MPRVGSRARMEGIVISDKMDKSVIVTVERRTRHPRYKKYITRQKKYAAHDETNRCRTGDRVEIVSTRPLSKTKRWSVARILESTQPCAEATAEEISR